MKKTLQILGGGCKRCAQLVEMTDQAAKSLGIEYTLEKVADLKQIAAHGVVYTPALVVDGQVKFFGKVPPVDEIKRHIVYQSP